MVNSRQTRQKEIIESEIKKNNSIFTAEQLFKKVQNKDKKIGIATIYRFLKNMRKKGRMHSFICEKKTIYSLHKPNHCHFICESCGKTEHIEVNDLNFLKNKIKNICHFQLDVYGVCDDCKKINMCEN